MRDTILTDAERQILDTIYRLEHVGVPEPRRDGPPRRISPVPIVLVTAWYFDARVDVTAEVAALEKLGLVDIAPLRPAPIQQGQRSYQRPDGQSVTALGPEGLGRAVTLTGAGLSEVRRDDVETRADPPAVAEQPGAGYFRGVKKLSPCVTKAHATYRWAIKCIPGAEDMTVAQLYNAIESHPGDASDALPPCAETFAKYLRIAGIRRYSAGVDRAPTQRVRTSDQF